MDRARTGDEHARQELIAGHLPLVYNIVGRALNGHPDTDDVVQETMLRAVDGLPGLREAGAFRSWLVAIALNQVRHRHRDQQSARTAQLGGGLDEARELADPAADFVGLTITRLGLSGQRREVAEATRWLDPADRELLALWWQEAAGEVSRAELAAALELSAQHAAVRVQRVKERLDTARVVVRALAARPACPELAALTADWDGAPAALWRKRIARHAGGCATCQGQVRDLVPAEGLLAGLALLPLPRRLHLRPTADANAAGNGAGRGTPGRSSSGRGSSGRGSSGRSDTGRGESTAHRRTPGHGGRRRPGGGRRRATRPRGRKALATLAIGTLAAVTATGLLWRLQPAQGTTAHAAGAVSSAAEPASLLFHGTYPLVGATSGTAPSATPSTEGPVASTVPSPSPSTPTAAATTKAPPSTAAPRGGTSATVAGYAQQVLDLVNAQRAQNGCGPLTANSKLQAAAQGQSDDMAARHFFDHTNPDGADPQQRIDKAGYQWSSWGENIAQGQADPAAVMDSWMNSSGHRANILNCAFKEIGVGIHLGPNGPWWTQDFGSPA
ncbi:sigma-70 family RNA polymerase sigma factor [Kitasatospora sp. NBC_01287]|uniref:sigma-70 family RNA polymerase sigma factor n=1 Tax=Kitasatospora sp. NBC_01287 TaxID=2903573 RepID=UPI00224D5BE6|nr:sigma-70 family RNA polymerase sigma factor [Kitasatospora sp. NBC_01287]MCX4745495.1 sigma-70 family RNA polymerase sigma factor [Kitasatospora sp. NBC_01287]